MRLRRMWALTATTAVAVAAGGCDGLWYHIDDDCELMLTCEHFRPTSSATGGGGTNAVCDADPTEDASTVTDECAVFANPNAPPGGDGSKAMPFASLAEAVANAHGKRVLACSSSAFAESLTLDAEIELIGGFDCDAEWTWSAEARSAIDAPAGQIALTLTNAASGAKVRSFAVRAASATEPGGSSIGVAVADVEAKLERVDVTAGDGMDGPNGETPADAPLAGASAEAMKASNACVAPNQVIGGTAGATTCEDGETRGGDGGTGGITGTEEGNGLAGSDGEPMPVPNPEEYGLGGRGQSDPSGNCRSGVEGAPGAPGGPGSAGSGAALTLAGISGGDGGPGMTGGRGQGGGGGGGAKAGTFCSLNSTLVDGVGASGGGGGAGGCGGKGGGGGKAGGSSIGILSLGTKLVLTEVTVTVGKAGKGGDGAHGQPGALGGEGAAGGERSGFGDSKRGCQGGNGGDGGLGGSGGGGRGGHAIGIAFASTPAAAPELKTFAPGTAGNGGSAAPGGPPESAGAPGSAGSCWDFESGRSCEN
ncbi:hypothetical protein WMF45_33495 [Sorangium sp. So ce448]|uniref:hypothetical protein n=1 Tax=Sorangium sp. So ce448 TaxID=3133314 RepID=UPI003F5DC248